MSGKFDPRAPGHAQVSTFTTDGTNINFFAHYVAMSEKLRPQLSHSLKSRPPPVDTAKIGAKKRKCSSRGDRVKDGLGHKT